MSQFSCEIAAVEGGRVRKRVDMNNAAMGFFNCNSFYPLKCYTVVSLLGFGFVEVIDFIFFLIKEN